MITNFTIRAIASVLPVIESVLQVIELERNGYLLSKVGMNAEFTHVFELTLSEKLQLVEDLWDSIASDPDQIPMLDWQKKELVRRRAAHLQNPDSGSAWETAKERIRSRDTKRE